MIEQSSGLWPGLGLFHLFGCTLQRFFMSMKSVINHPDSRKLARLIFLIVMLVVMHLQSSHDSFGNLLSNMSAICTLIEFVGSDKSKAKS